MLNIGPQTRFSKNLAGRHPKPVSGLDEIDDGRIMHTAPDTSHA
ncbi:hypothetical protein [Nitrosovibrio sp. Nv17]|nr:hypothetical protein [Nitrosovibrio sp. Nv17]